jgi:hypothetical protein
MNGTRCGSIIFPASERFFNPTDFGFAKDP